MLVFMGCLYLVGPGEGFADQTGGALYCGVISVLGLVWFGIIVEGDL
jgi:hypothetical protein